MSDVRYRRLNGYLRSFFKEYLRMQRGVSTNTIQSYRDSWCLLFRYGIEQKKMPRAENWRIYQVDRQLILDFLTYLEEERRVCIRTRNLRLAAIHAFFHYLRICEPELGFHCLRILYIPSKKTRRTIISFLESDELVSVLQSVCLQNPLGHRDLALLTFAYNTGARVHEIAKSCKNDILPGISPVIRILGKGGKERIVPLWEGTLQLLETYLRKYRAHPKSAAHSEYLFLSSRGQKLTRFHVGRIITRYINDAAQKCPSMQKKRLCAHSMRHTTAVHLLQGGAEPNVIKAWLGHSSVESSQVYLDLDLRKKREVLDSLVTPELARSLFQAERDCSKDNLTLIDWLEKL